MKAVFDIQDIQDRIPHRAPFLLLDRVISLEKNQSLVAIKNVTCNEPFFSGHFPGIPLMPGVLMVEAIAQAGGLLITESLKITGAGNTLYLVGVDRARFKKIVTPGDQLRIKVELLKARRDIWKVQGVIDVNDAVVCSAVIMLAKESS